jgi:fused signal recognition particle receptor
MAFFDRFRKKDKPVAAEMAAATGEDVETGVATEAAADEVAAAAGVKAQANAPAASDATVGADVPAPAAADATANATVNAETPPEVEAAVPEAMAGSDPVPKTGFFQRLRNGLSKTRGAITTRIDQMLAGFGKVDEELFEELEEILITSDVGMETSLRIVSDLRERVRRDRIADAEGVRRAIREEIAGILASEAGTLRLDTRPSVLVVIGVNGVGKTTSIGKIAHLLKGQGKKVMVAAADTFRAAAIDQLEIWTECAGVPIVKHEEGSDPAAVIFDAIAAAKARGTDVLIVDTAGRLHTKKNLMEELRKIFRIIGRELPDADVETLLVLDATTGQNAVSQAKVFAEVGNLTGLVLTKLDGTAKGGIVISIMSELNVPVKFVGGGEKMDDLQVFNPDSFVAALFGEG